jgi:hypothetical protein
MKFKYLFHSIKNEKRIMKNPIKIWLLVITILLVAITVIILFVKPKTESGEKVSYFSQDDAEASPTTSPTSAPLVVAQ